VSITPFNPFHPFNLDLQLKLHQFDGGVRWADRKLAFKWCCCSPKPPFFDYWGPVEEAEAEGGNHHHTHNHEPIHQLINSTNQIRIRPIGQF